VKLLVGYAVITYIARSGSADPGEWDNLVPTELAELADIPTSPDKANAEAPTFLPTSLKLQTYTYVEPVKSSGYDGVDENMLLYLEMTRNKTIPEALLNRRGNFAAPKMDGSICIS
jgi:hypothetical protein